MGQPAVVAVAAVRMFSVRRKGSEDTCKVLYLNPRVTDEGSMPSS
jgi:hypothetical protein